MAQQNCEDSFSKIANLDGVRFIGNVSVGPCPELDFKGLSVSLQDLANHYDGIVFAYGASFANTLNLPGDYLAGIYPAQDFVSWYNGHPGVSDMLFKELRDAEEATVIGHGNVALDVARILLMDPEDLKRTDMAYYAVNSLMKSKIRKVHVVGRRGAAQASFTRKELAELLKLKNVGFSKKYFPINLLPAEMTKDMTPAERRLYMTLKEMRERTLNRDPQGKNMSLAFQLQPSKFVGFSRVTGTEFVKNILHFPLDRNERPAATDESVTIPSQIVFKATGTKGQPLVGMTELGMAFDRMMGTILSDETGRVASPIWARDNSRHRIQGRIQPFAWIHDPIPGLYCAGWIHTGAKGTIVNTWTDAVAVAETIKQDWTSGARFLLAERLNTPKGWDALKEVVGGGMLSDEVVDWNGWQKINRTERELGARHGKPRSKLISTRDMLVTSGSGRPRNTVVSKGV